LKLFQEYADFKDMVLRPYTKGWEELVEEAFDNKDTDNDGSITMKEFLDAFRPKKLRSLAQLVIGMSTT